MNKVPIQNYIAPFIAAIPFAYLILRILKININLVTFIIAYGILAAASAIQIVIITRKDKRQ